MIKYKSFLAPLIESYIIHQDASDSYKSTLLTFNNYCLKHYPYEKELSQEMVDSWCKQRDTEINNSCRTRILPILSFIEYLRKRDKTQVIKPVLPKAERSTYIPHFFTDEELKNFFNVCDNIKLTNNTTQEKAEKIIIPVLFRLLYSSGLRTIEARMLKVADVNLEEGILNIRESKGHAQHYVVLHDSMLELFKKYDCEINVLYPNRTYFFPAKEDTYYKKKWLCDTFRELWDKDNDSYATAYELRHHYAITNINKWIEKGFDFLTLLLYLSKSMGHNNLESTKYYYTLVPYLASILEEKTLASFDEIVPEVNYEKI